MSQDEPRPERPEPEATEPGEGELRFDAAQWDEAPEAEQGCFSCGGGLEPSYFTVNGLTLCSRCKDAVVDQGAAGGKAGRFFRAAGAGFGAACVGAGLYYAVAALTGYEVGLIGILVAFMVGAAVRWGCNRRGGWFYQALAMVLTYVAICATYAPAVVRGLTEGGDMEINIVILSVVVGVVTLIAPFLSGFDNIIGWFILGISLYEAWKMNRKTEVVITGPHSMGEVPGGSSGA